MRCFCAAHSHFRMRASGTAFLIEESLIFQKVPQPENLNTGLKL